MQILYVNITYICLFNIFIRQYFCQLSENHRKLSEVFSEKLIKTSVQLLRVQFLWLSHFYKKLLQ